MIPMVEREIDWAYLESLPTVLEIKPGFDVAVVPSLKEAIKGNLIQPSFVAKVFAESISESILQISLVIPFGLVLNFRLESREHVIQVEEATPCCFSPFRYYTSLCGRCSNDFSSTAISPLESFWVSTKYFLSEAGGETGGEAEAKTPLEVASQAFTYNISNLFQDRGMDSFNSILVAGELWSFLEAMSEWSEAVAGE